jgi:hypothetical protein
MQDRNGPKTEEVKAIFGLLLFRSDRPSEELPTQLFKWRLLQATKVPVSLW